MRTGWTISTIQWSCQASSDTKRSMWWICQRIFSTPSIQLTKVFRIAGTCNGSANAMGVEFWRPRLGRILFHSTKEMDSSRCMWKRIWRSTIICSKLEKENGLLHCIWRIRCYGCNKKICSTTTRGRDTQSTCPGRAYSFGTRYFLWLELMSDSASFSKFSA